jgi:eukaryotic-like serine/threonine-protein kinase
VQAGLAVEEVATPEDAAIARPQQSLAAGGGVTGAPPYMLPEQCQPGTVLDERTDIYALGCIFYELLAGRPPFAVEIQPTTPETYQRWLSAWQRQHESADRSTFPNAIPDPLANLLTTCLAQDRDEWPASVRRLAGWATASVYAASRPGCPTGAGVNYLFVR